VHRKYIPTCIQQDATLHILFISGNCSTCLEWYFHPSSGAHTTVSTAFGICHTVTAICHYRGKLGTVLNVLWVAYATHSTLKPVPTLDDGWKYHPKHVQQFPDISKLCNVASCWIYILECSYDARTHEHPMHVNPLNPELNPICYLLPLLAHHFLHVNRIRVKSLTLRLLMSCVYTT
jgi:hypothetical protein